MVYIQIIKHKAIIGKIDIVVNAIVNLSLDVDANTVTVVKIVIFRQCS